MNGVCKITIAFAGLESGGRKRKVGGIRGIILKPKARNLQVPDTHISEVREAF